MLNQLLLKILSFYFLGQILSLPSLPQITTGPIRLNNNSLGIKTTAQSILIVDKKTNKILYAKNPFKKRPLASITKLLTALVVLDQKPNWEKDFIFLESDIKEGSRLLIYPWERVKIRDLFYLGLVNSNNHAMAALVRALGFKEKDFVDKMNQKAKELGLVNYQFTDPTGFDFQNQATAFDILKIARAAFDQEEITKALRHKRYTTYTLDKHRRISVYNTDFLLDSYLNQGDYKIIGAKTGYLDEAGYCFVFDIQKNNAGEILGVILGAESAEARWQETKALVEWVFNNYQWK